MCGLFGIWRPRGGELASAELECARLACDELTHRGPDQYGEYVQGNLYMGHRRLSILDLSERGRQPMVSDDGAVAVTVNGEIYNFQALRRELGEEQFRSSSDSEVVLHGYRAWGIEKLLSRIEGMFAFTVLDHRSGQLYLARDHSGIKPLYYGNLNGYVFWASELKAVRRFFGPDRLPMDNTALYDFLTYRYVPAPKTQYLNCYKVEPGCYITVDLATGGFLARRYWQLPTEEIDVSANEAGERIRESLGASVEEQLVSDVPLGFFLSGGIDSSTVVAEAAARHDDLASFAIGYDVAAHDETNYADIVANRFATRHTKRVLTADHADDLMARMEGWYDEPFADTSALPTWHVSRLAREDVSVVLTGDGADELFGGYRWYERYARFRKLQSLLLPGMKRGPRTNLAARSSGLVRKFSARADLLSRRDPLELYATLLTGYIGPEKKHYRRVLAIEEDYDDMWHFRRHYRPELPLRKRMQYLDFHTYLPDDILTKVDRVTMAVSLEARVPFLSRSLVELAFSLPQKVLYHRGQLKGVLKHAYRDVLPEQILNRGKKGFSIPLHQWDSSTGENALLVQDRIAARYLSGQGA
jgi:asparagine synthase (glutamine-hydrolysing)